LPAAAFIYNITPHTSTKYSKFELVFGKSFRCQDCYNFTPVILATTREKDLVSSLKERLQYSHDLALKALMNSKEVSKKHYGQMENTVIFREEISATAKCQK
jgi:hypothetical protein